MSDVKPAMSAEEWAAKATGDDDTGDVFLYDGGNHGGVGSENPSIWAKGRVK